MELSREGFDEGDPATGCGWAVAELATPEVLADKRVLARARRKVADGWVEGRAMRSGRRELAVDVFRAADHPGFRQRLLRQRCLVLAGIGVDDKERSPRPKLRVVEPPGGHR